MTRLRRFAAMAASGIVALSFAGVALANHSWGGYHWAGSSNPRVLTVGDNVTSAWDAYLDQAIADWNVSTSIHLNKVSGGTTAKNCKPVAGRMEVCNSKYGNTGWLGIASVWANGTHITQATTKLNDTYFVKAAYNTPGWRRLVTCQEIAHDFGLDHQDENFNNPNLGSCMDYTNIPAGPPSNEHPNAHDYEELGIIYGHIDGAMDLPPSGPGNGNGQEIGNDPASWGQVQRNDERGRPSIFKRDLGNGQKVFTFVTWADDEEKGNGKQN